MNVGKKRANSPDDSETMYLFKAFTLFHSFPVLLLFFIEQLLSYLYQGLKCLMKNG